MVLRCSMCPMVSKAERLLSLLFLLDIFLFFSSLDNVLLYSFFFIAYVYIPLFLIK